METFINELTPQEKKARVKSWIYQWLATLEIQDIEEAKKSESGQHESIQIKFKR